MSTDRTAAARAIDAFLAAIGRDPNAEPELRGTGERVAAAFIDELTSGYGVDVDALVKGNLLRADATAAEQTNAGVVELRAIPVTTTCPHHLMSGVGVASVAFAPRESILGVGAIARVVHAFARRLALQEVIGEGVVEALEQHLRPRWVGCRIELTHTCMVARGERPHGAKLVTLAVRAIDDAARAEAIRYLKEGEP